MNKNRVVLVTGATGFVGSYLVRLLVQKGYKIRGLKRPSSKFDLLKGFEDAVEWVDADVTDIIGLEDAYKGVTDVFHCAANVSFNPKDAAEMFRTNVEGTANVVNLALDYKIDRLIHVSSIAALGRSADRLELDEKCEWVQSKGNSRYAISKHLAEYEIWRGVAEGLSAAVVSPSIVVGSRSWDRGMAAFFKKVDEGLKFCPTGQSGFVDVRDVVEFMEVLLNKKEIVGERYILNGVNIPHKTFFNMIAKELNVAPPSIMVGPFLAEVAWRVEWLKEKLLGIDPMATKESARSSVTKYIYKNEKSLTMDGFTYRPFSNTIEDTARQYKLAKVHNHQPMVLDF